MLVNGPGILVVLLAVGVLLVGVLLGLLLPAQLLTEAAFGRVLQRGFLAVQEVRRLGEHVVAQVHDHELGRQWLAGVPRRALRLAAPALGAGGEVEQALPGEVLDLADADFLDGCVVLDLDRDGVVSNEDLGRFFGR